MYLLNKLHTLHVKKNLEMISFCISNIIYINVITLINASTQNGKCFQLHDTHLMHCIENSGANLLT
jgi:hypothetical protein